MPTCAGRDAAHLACRWPPAPPHKESFSPPRAVPALLRCVSWHTGQLGDGRAISLGEAVNPEGEHWELQLKVGSKESDSIWSVEESDAMSAGRGLWSGAGWGVRG